MALTNNDIFMMLSRGRSLKRGEGRGNNNSSGNSDYIPLLALIMQFRLRGSNDLCPSRSLKREKEGSKGRQTDTLVLLLLLQLLFFWLLLLSLEGLMTFYLLLLNAHSFSSSRLPPPWCSSLLYYYFIFTFFFWQFCFVVDHLMPHKLLI